jgi:hypothetical protein
MQAQIDDLITSSLKGYKFMFERLSYLYKANRLTPEQLDIAVSKTWITEKQKAEITGKG